MKVTTHIGPKALKHPIARILSLCLVVGIAGTSTSFSQTEKADTSAIAAVTLPVERTITDTKGRATSGTVIGKSDTAITFRRASDQKEFEIKLDSLSADDKSFLAGIPNLVKRPSILWVASSYPEFPTHSEDIQWLSSQGFDVTVGLIHQPKFTAERTLGFFKAPPEQKVVVLNPLSTMDQFDVLWIPKFYTATARITEPEFDCHAIVNHWHESKRPLVIRCRPGEDDATRFRRFKPRTDQEARQMAKKEQKNFVSQQGSWIFYSDNLVSDQTQTTKENVITRVKRNLKK
jgi:hypothetical protein